MTQVRNYSKECDKSDTLARKLPHSYEIGEKICDEEKRCEKCEKSPVQNDTGETSFKEM